VGYLAELGDRGAEFGDRPVEDSVEVLGGVVEVTLR
jgi:hypothetical protein